MIANHNTRLRVIAKKYRNGESIIFETKGRNAQTLIALVNAGDKGMTALEMSSWAFRLSAYVHVLRTRYNLDVKTLTEEHIGGNHARYVLREPVEILEMIEA